MVSTYRGKYHINNDWSPSTYYPFATKNIKVLMFFFYGAVWSYRSWRVQVRVSFVSNRGIRLSRNPSLTLQVPLCKSKTFKSSYFNQLVKFWKHVCKPLPPLPHSPAFPPSTTFASLSSLYHIFQPILPLQHSLAFLPSKDFLKLHTRTWCWQHLM